MLGGSVLIKRIILEFVVVFLAIWIAAGTVLLLDVSPSPIEIESDLVPIRKEIAATKLASEKFEGGLIKILIDLRGEILRTTEAMLEQKQKAIIRRIDLKYTVEGKLFGSSAKESQEEILKDIRDARIKLAQAEQEAQKYSGGLLQIMALMNVELAKLTLAQLEFSLLAQKHGVALPAKFKLPTKPEELEPPGNIVNDRKALN
jgi:hypothetical protein